MKGSGAYQYEGIYNENGKFTIQAADLVMDPEECAVSETVKLTASFLISRTTGITNPSPRGYVSFKLDGNEICTAQLIATGEENGITGAIAEFNWNAIEGKHEISAEYVPGAGDSYEPVGQAKYEAVIVDHIHIWDEDFTVDVQPDCIHGGSQSVHCQLCDAKKDITSISALGHSFTKYIPDNNATCAENGTETAKCDRCDATDTRVIENSTVEHHYSSEWTIDKEPTCTEPSSKSHHCVVCGDKADITEIPAAHSFGAWVVTVPPTSDTEGVRERKCSVCGEVEKRTIAPAAAMPQIVVDSKTTHAGDTITVNVSVKNNPGIIAMLLHIEYDSSVLELQKATGKDFEDVSFGPLDHQPFTVFWEDSIHPNTTTNGSVVELVFKVKDDAAFGQTAITVTYDEENIFNSDFENVFFEVLSGTVDILKYQPGDLNRDASVNMKDYALFRQYLTGWDVDIELSVADLSGDAIVNMKDLALLRQWLNGWEVVSQ